MFVICYIHIMHMPMCSIRTCICTMKGVHTYVYVDMYISPETAKKSELQVSVLFCH